MKIEILRGVVIDNGETTKEGDKVEVSDTSARHLIRIGKAKEVTEKAPVEKKIKK